MPVVDYRRAREVLRARRFDLGLGVNELAKKAQIERTTVYRVENLRELPNYKPEFETMEALATALGLTLSQFFAQIESLQSPTATSTTDEPPHNLPSTESAVRPVGSQAPDADSVVPLSVVGAQGFLVQLLGTLGIELVGAIDRAADRIIAAREQTTGARAKQTRRGAPRRHPHRKVG